MKAGIGITAILLSGLVLFSCMSNEQTQETLENSTPETVDLLVSLGGSSRAERFLGTFDEIEKLTLDIERNFDNRQVVTGFPLTRDNTSTWSGTVNSLIVDFYYTFHGHAYNDLDNGSLLEIFSGKTENYLVQGDNQTNMLSLRLSPILDSRVLEVPRIMRINRPFQMEKNTSP